MYSKVKVFGQKMNWYFYNKSWGIIYKLVFLTVSSYSVLQASRHSEPRRKRKRDDYDDYWPHLFHTLTFHWLRNVTRPCGLVIYNHCEHVYILKSRGRFWRMYTRTNVTCQRFTNGTLPYSLSLLHTEWSKLHSVWVLTILGATGFRSTILYIPMLSLLTTSRHLISTSTAIQESFYMNQIN